jgi:hypothetical protein
MFYESPCFPIPQSGCGAARTIKSGDEEGLRVGKASHRVDNMTLDDIVAKKNSTDTGDP